MTKSVIVYSKFKIVLKRFLNLSKHSIQEYDSSKHRGVYYNHRNRVFDLKFLFDVSHSEISFKPGWLIVITRHPVQEWINRDYIPRSELVRIKQGILKRFTRFSKKQIVEALE